jgi:flagellar basal body-associated protein FliL
VAEEKKKEGDAKVDAAPKKRLPTLVLVALGAIAGGAGVVFAVPPKTIEVKVEAKVHEIVDVTHPDPIAHDFNPRTKPGNRIMRVQFKFVYTVREDREPDAFGLIKQHWDQVNSDVLVLLKQRSAEELQSDGGRAMLEKDIIDDLDRVLFPAGQNGEKVARVTRVMWSKFLMQ